MPRVRLQSRGGEQPLVSASSAAADVLIEPKPAGPWRSLLHNIPRLVFVWGSGSRTAAA